MKARKVFSVMLRIWLILMTLFFAVRFPLCLAPFSANHLVVNFISSTGPQGLVKRGSIPLYLAVRSDYPRVQTRWIYVENEAEVMSWTSYPAQYAVDYCLHGYIEDCAYSGDLNMDGVIFVAESARPVGTGFQWMNYYLQSASYPAFLALLILFFSVVFLAPVVLIVFWFILCVHKRRRLNET